MCCCIPARPPRAGGSGAGGGGNDGDNEEGAGGGGSGGTVYLVAGTLHIDGALSALGGLGGRDDYVYNVGANRECCNNGGPGSVGRIRLDYDTVSGSQSITPAAHSVVHAFLPSLFLPSLSPVGGGGNTSVVCDGSAPYEYCVCGGSCSQYGPAPTVWGRPYCTCGEALACCSPSYSPGYSAAGTGPDAGPLDESIGASAPYFYANLADGYAHLGDAYLNPFILAEGYPLADGSNPLAEALPKCGSSPVTAVFFEYHMYGEQMGTLSLKDAEGVTQWSRIGQQSPGPSYSNWAPSGKVELKDRKSVV